MNQIRQGDILLVAIEKQLPSGLLAKKTVILAEGEVTGHSHVLSAPIIMEWEEQGQRYVRVVGSKPGELFHQDHDPLPVAVVEPETTYRVMRQQEIDLSGQWRKVQD